METRQFVIISPSGEEVRCIDPVESFENTDTHWVVRSGYLEYAFKKAIFPGHTVRFKVLTTVWSLEDIEY